MNFATLRNLVIPEGVVSHIVDENGMLCKIYRFIDDSYIDWNASRVYTNENGSYSVVNDGNLYRAPYDYDAISLDGRLYSVSWTLEEAGTSSGDIYSGAVIGLDGMRFEWESRDYMTIYIRCDFTWESLIFGNFE